MRVFLDANVLFSAARAGSLVARALSDLTSRGTDLVTCEHAVVEARKNLAAKRAEDLPGLEALLPALEITKLMADAGGLELADKDRPVFGGAMATGCSHFVTGDLKHFGPWMGQTVAGVRVLTLAALVREVVVGRSGSAEEN